MKTLTIKDLEARFDHIAISMMSFAERLGFVWVSDLAGRNYKVSGTGTPNVISLRGDWEGTPDSKFTYETANLEQI